MVRRLETRSNNVQEQSRDQQNEERHKKIRPGPAHIRVRGLRRVQHDQVFTCQGMRPVAIWREVFTVVGGGIEIVDFRPNVTVRDVKTLSAGLLAIGRVGHSPLPIDSCLPPFYRNLRRFQLAVLTDNCTRNKLTLSLAN